MKTRHPFYTIMDLKGDVLFSELNSWSRLDLIEWLPGTITAFIKMKNL
jgi:hypothetical protein